MAVPDRPVSSTDIMEELGHEGGVLGLTDDDVVALADVGIPVGQLDLEGKSSGPPPIDVPGEIILDAILVSGVANYGGTNYVGYNKSPTAGTLSPSQTTIGDGVTQILAYYGSATVIFTLGLSDISQRRIPMMGVLLVSPSGDEYTLEPIDYGNKSYMMASTSLPSLFTPVGSTWRVILYIP